MIEGLKKKPTLH